MAVHVDQIADLLLSRVDQRAMTMTSKAVDVHPTARVVVWISWLLSMRCWWWFDPYRRRTRPFESWAVVVVRWNTNPLRYMDGISKAHPTVADCKTWLAARDAGDNYGDRGTIAAAAAAAAADIGSTVVVVAEVTEQDDDDDGKVHVRPVAKEVCDGRRVDTGCCCGTQHHHHLPCWPACCGCRQRY